MSDIFLDPTSLSELVTALSAIRDQYAMPPPGRQTPPGWEPPLPGLPPRPSLPPYSDVPPLLPPDSPKTLRQVLNLVFGDVQQPRSVGGELRHLSKVEKEIENQQKPPAEQPLVSFAPPSEIPPPVADLPWPLGHLDRDASRPVLPPAVPNTGGLPPDVTRFVLPQNWLLEVTPGNAVFGRRF